MVKEWTKLPRFTSEYISGVMSFLDFAYTRGRPQGAEILCPCSKCGNTYWSNRNIVYDHLIAFGFIKGYTYWVHHGERIPQRREINVDLGVQEDSDNDGLLYDTSTDIVEANEVTGGPNKNVRKFHNLVGKAKQELCPRCKKFSTLAFMDRLNLLKCMHGWSNASFTALLELLEEVMPDLNISVSYNKTKSGRVQSYGRTKRPSMLKKNEEMAAMKKQITPSMLKKNEEMAAMKKQHFNEYDAMSKKILGMEALLKCLLKQNNPHLDDEALDAIKANALGSKNSAAPGSSTSTFVPNGEKQNIVGDEEDLLQELEED